MVLGLLMARAGVAVTVLEKHGRLAPAAWDRLRDFRGDTVHASTLTPHRLLDRIEGRLDGGTVQIADMRRLPGAHQHIAMVPQWDFLEMLADAAAEEPSFTLRRDAEVTGLLRDGARVTGVRYTDRTTGEEHELRADVTVACDGRGSAVRAAAGLAPRTFGVPMDVWWFRLPRRDTDPVGGVGRFSAGHLCVMIDRGDYWQCAYPIRKGADTALRAAGVGELRNRLARPRPARAARRPVIAGIAGIAGIATTRQQPRPSRRTLDDRSSGTRRAGRVRDPPVALSTITRPDAGPPLTRTATPAPHEVADPGPGRCGGPG